MTRSTLRAPGVLPLRPHGQPHALVARPRYACTCFGSARNELVTLTTVTPQRLAAKLAIDFDPTMLKKFSN